MKIYISIPITGHDEAEVREHADLTRAMLAMARLRGSGKLNDKNVDCFIQGYKACMEALYIPYKLIPVLRYHHKELSGVKQHILDAIGYADLRRGINEEESSNPR